MTKKFYSHGETGRGASSVALFSFGALSNAASLVASETTEFIGDQKKFIASMAAGNVYLLESSAEAALLLEGEPRAHTSTQTALERHLEAKARSTGAQAHFYVLSPQGQVLGSSEGASLRGTWRRDDPCLEGDEIVIRTSDTGPGIVADLEAHIFEPYFSTKDAHNGSGLGLFISRRIVEQMDGELEYDASDDSGASFVIRVPIATQARMRA